MSQDIPQGGYVALATVSAMQAAGMTVTAAGPMSGPYALSAFADAIFMVEANGSAVLNFTFVTDSYQHSYGNVYTSATDIFSPQYAANIGSLLPSDTTTSNLYAQGLLPQNTIFSSTPPAPQYASMTPATTPANLAPAFALGFGPNPLVINAYRLNYLQDAQANPDRGFPTTTTDDAAYAANAGNTLRQDLAKNDLRDFNPAGPVLLCGGDDDHPTVFYFNTQLMQGYWAAHAPSAQVTVLDVDSAVGTNDPEADVRKEDLQRRRRWSQRQRLRGAPPTAARPRYSPTTMRDWCRRSVSTPWRGTSIASERKRHERKRQQSRKLTPRSAGRPQMVQVYPVTVARTPRLLKLPS